MGLVVALVLVVPQTATAGSRDDPEVEGPCEQVAVYSQPPGIPYPGVTPDWATPCAAWFETLSEPGEPTVLRTVLRLKGPIGDRPPSARYAMSWVAGGCQWSWSLSDTIIFPPERRLSVDCPEFGQVPLPFAAQVEEVGDTVAVTLDFAAPALRGWAGAYATGETITEPRAAAFNWYSAWAVAVQPGGHDIGPGRPYRVGD